MLLNLFIFSASFANPLSPPQYPGCGCTGTTCESSRCMKFPADGDRSLQGSLGPCPGVPDVTSAGFAAPFGGGQCGRSGQPPRPPCCGSPPHATLLTPQDLLYCSVMSKLLGNWRTILILIYVTWQWVRLSCFPSSLLITNCSSQTHKVSAQPRSD